MDKKISNEFIEKEFWIVKNTKNNLYYKDSISDTKDKAQIFLDYLLSYDKEISAILVKVNLTEIDEWRKSLNVDDEGESSEIVGGINEVFD